MPAARGDQGPGRRKAGVPQGKCRGAAGQQAGGPAPATQAGGGGGGRGGGGFYISSPARLFFIKRLFLSVKLRGLVIVRFCRWYHELRRRVLCWLEPDNEINPVASTILHATLSFPISYGPGLIKDVELWAKELLDLKSKKVLSFLWLKKDWLR